MSNQVAIRVKAVDEASGVFKKVEGSAGGLKTALAGVATVAGGVLAAGVLQKGAQALTGYVSNALGQASKLEQSIGGVESVFKENAQQILDWGKTAAQQAGLSKNAFNEIAAPIGAMLKNAGFEDFTQRTIDLTKKGADLAATFGGSVQDAMGAISSLMRGEANPIEKYGVSIKQVDVNLRALANTGKKSERDLTALELASARLDLLFEQTADSVGQAAREIDTAASKEGQLRASRENMAAQMGTYLLPLQVRWTELQMKATQFLATQVIPTLDTFAKYIRFVVQDGDKLNDFLADLPPGLRGFAMAVADVVLFVKEHWGTITTIFETVKEQVKAQIEGFILQVRGIYTVMDGVVDLISALWHGKWNEAWEAAKQITDGALQFIEGSFRRVFGILPELAKAGLNAAIDAINAFFNGFEGKELFPSIDLGPLGSTPAVKIPGIPDIPRLARGGIVTGPTLAVVGDNPGGREAIIPLDGTEARELGNTFYITNLNLHGVQDPAGLAQALQAAGVSVP